MATGIAEIIVLGLLVDWLLRRCGVPGLIGMMAVGALLGPFVLDYLSPDLISIGGDLRLIALIVILLRAGFALQRRALHQTGGRILLLAFIPATGEGIVIALAGQWLLNLTLLEAALLGSVVAAVSPAVIVPAMLRLIQEGRGRNKGVPTMVMAAASVDDVYVIVVHAVLLGAYMGAQNSLAGQLVGVPVSLLLGASAGMGIGLFLCYLFDRFNPRATKRVLMVIACSILLVRLQDLLAHVVPFAGLVSAMAIGFAILERREQSAHEIAAKLAKIWVFAEIILFSMVGAQVNLLLAWQTGLAGAMVIGLGLLARGAGTMACLTGSPLNTRERVFVMLAFFPKATVQAAIGAGPLLAMRAAGMDAHAGEIILAVAVLSIVLTAPLGAWAIACAGPRLLAKE
jgi:solute carrier family 9B (sodium/hydrogen exchanger), member 1/2